MSTSAHDCWRNLANHAARDIASPAAKMGSRSLFPGVAVPLAFFCTLFFRHRKKSVSAPWDGQSQSAPESARQAPPKGNFLRQSCRLSMQAGAPCTPSGSRRVRPRRGQGRGLRLRAHWGLSSGQTIGAVRTAVRSACCLPELRGANRLRRLYPLDTRFPLFPPAPLRTVVGEKTHKGFPRGNPSVQPPHCRALR